MAPSGMALASWNAVPGDATYSWKTSLETVLLAALPSDKLKSATNSKLTERRMGEVSKVLSGTHAREGLDNLSAQVLTTKESLRKINNAQDRAVAVALYIQTLNEVNSQLETEKQSRAVAYLPTQQADTNQFSIKNLRRPSPVNTNNDTTNYNNTNTNTVATAQPAVNYAPPSTTQPTQRPIGQLSQPVTTQPTPTIQPIIVQPTQQPVTTQLTSPAEPTEEELINEGVSEEIGQTQEQINNVIHDLEDIIAEAEQEAATTTNTEASTSQPKQDETQQRRQQQQGTNEEEIQRGAEQRQENENNGREQQEPEGQKNKDKE